MGWGTSADRNQGGHCIDPFHPGQHRRWKPRGKRPETLGRRSHVRGRLADRYRADDFFLASFPRALYPSLRGLKLETSFAFQFKSIISQGSSWEFKFLFFSPYLWLGVRRRMPRLPSTGRWAMGPWLWAGKAGGVWPCKESQRGNALGMKVLLQWNIKEKKNHKCAGGTTSNAGHPP